MAWTGPQKTALAIAAAVAGLCVLQSRRRYAEHNGAPARLDADLKKPVREAVLAALQLETDPAVLAQLKAKLEAAGFERTAESVGEKLTRLEGQRASGRFFTGAAAPPRGAAPVVGHGSANIVTGAQQKLRALGWDVETDGVVGPKTRRAILEFQSLHDLDIDGILGPETLAALDAAVQYH
ncbi:MAG TPA: peptidoglycan-binding domain-containing protein [Thermoanaerobaculia bacterium]|nr:peptidoglycan-binding domain-containing protein [Thermoanaerobaculia bacterium]